MARSARKRPLPRIAKIRRHNVAEDTGTEAPSRNSPRKGPVNGARRFVSNTISIAIGAVKPNSTHIHIVVPTGGATLYQVTKGNISLDKPHHFRMVKSRIGNTKSRPREMAKAPQDY